MWICDRCETYNPDEITKCRLCGAEMPLSHSEAAEKAPEQNTESDRQSPVLFISNSLAEQPAAFNKPMEIDLMTETLETAKSSAKEIISDKENALDEQYANAVKKRIAIYVFLILLNIGLLAAIIQFLYDLYIA